MKRNRIKTNWNKLQDITGGRIYTLNENYRNTLQITMTIGNRLGLLCGEAAH